MVGHSRAVRRTGLALALLFCAGLAVAAGAPPVHYTLDPERSLLRFTFTQAGASNTGRFAKFTTDLLFAQDNLAASKLEVTVNVASLDTGDADRDATLLGPDLFDVATFPNAKFVATSFTAAGTSRWDAQGKLTIRNVTKDLKVPLTFQTKSEQGKNVGYLTGKVTIRRNDFGVGQGEWKSTEQVADEVVVSFSLRLPASS